MFSKAANAISMARPPFHVPVSNIVLGLKCLISSAFLSYLEGKISCDTLSFDSSNTRLPLESLNGNILELDAPAICIT